MVWDKIRNKASFLWGKTKEIIAILSGIMTIAFKITDKNPIFTYILCFIAIAYILFIGFYVVKNILNTNRAKIEFENAYIKKNKELAKRLHSYNHNLRDYISQTSINNVKSIKDLKDKCKHICDYISGFYETLFYNYLGGKSVAVCVKIIDSKNLLNNDYKNCSMITLARSTSTDQSRVNIDSKPVKIVDNTDFEIIVSEAYDDNLFSSPDMRNIADDFLETYKTEYKNSRGSNFLDYYKSTIVIPIRIDGADASGELKGLIPNLDKKSLYLGFLCIDSLKVFSSEEEKEIFAAGVEYGKSFGDSLYLFFGKALPTIIKNDKIATNKAQYSSESYTKGAYNTTKRGKGKRGQ